MIRQLEGNLNKIKMFAELQGVPISLELARKILATHDYTRNLSKDYVQKIVADHFRRFVLFDLKAKIAWTQPLVTARHNFNVFD